jgi:hypothetical protein
VVPEQLCSSNGRKSKAGSGSKVAFIQDSSTKGRGVERADSKETRRGESRDVEEPNANRKGIRTNSGGEKANRAWERGREGSIVV